MEIDMDEVECIMANMIFKVCYTQKCMRRAELTLRVDSGLRQRLHEPWPTENRVLSQATIPTFICSKSIFPHLSRVLSPGQEGLSL